MSLTPTPAFDMKTLKTFWERPEGKTGAAVLLASGCAALYGASLLLPWAIAFATDALHLLFLCIAFVGTVGVVTNKTFRSIVGNAFQLTMRWTTGLLIQIDPIGILKNNISQMEERNRELAKGIEGCAGAKKQLENQIASNEMAATHAKSIIVQADKQVEIERDPLRKQRLLLSKQGSLQEIGRRLHSNENLQCILQQTSRLYAMLTRWQNLAEYNIENARGEMQNLDAERKTILASYRAMGPAQRLIKGDPEQLKMVNASLEFLAEDNANKLGAMEDFARYSEKFLSNMDLEQGASAADAEKMLAEYEVKLLTAGTVETVPAEIVQESEAVPVARSKR